MLRDIIPSCHVNNDSFFTLIACYYYCLLAELIILNGDL